MTDNHVFNPKAEMMKRQEIEKIQFNKLKKTVNHVYENVPFFRERFRNIGLKPEDIRELGDIRKLPFMSKDDLRQNYPFGLSAVPLNEIVEIHASSGTTGTPTVELYTLRDIDVWGECMARCEAMSGLTKNDVFQITPGFGMFVGGFGMYYGARKINATIVPTGVGFSERQVQFAKDFRTTMLGSIVTYTFRLAEVAKQLGMDPAKDLQIRKMIVGAEQWSQDLKDRIRKIWNADVYDVYGLTEMQGNGTANDCYLHEGMHNWDDHFLLEIVDPKTGDPVEPEERGEVVMTSLSKEAMPKIRYRTRDVSFLYDTFKCDCGRTHSKIGWIVSRTDDMVKVSGVNIWPTMVETFLMKQDEAGMEYQMVINRVNYKDIIKVIVESKEKMDAATKQAFAKKVRAGLTQIMVQTPEVEIVDPGVLPREPGKAKKIFDQRNSS
jgi:phenylacetate-CoA ligase